MDMDTGNWKEWPMPGPPLIRYTKAEICDWLDVSDDTLDAMIDAGKFPRGYKISPKSTPTWTGKDIAAWLHLRDRWFPEAKPADSGRNQPKSADSGRKSESDKSGD